MVRTKRRLMLKIKHFFGIISQGIKYLTQNFKGILLAIFIIYLILPSGEEIRPANVVRIDLEGQIINSKKVLESIEDATKNGDIKGVLFVVNSPGGSVAPSIEISYAIKRLAAVKPVITYAEGSLASGSYYASIWSHKIFANPGSLIGSIGVIFQGYNLERVMETLGVATQIVKAGRYKEAGTFSRSWDRYEKQELETLIKDIYHMFIFDVSKARKLDINKEKVFADAHIFSAYRAKQVGLIDEVATIHEAKLELQSLTQLKKLIWQTPSAMDNFMEKVAAKIFTDIDTKLLQPTLK